MSPRAPEDVACQEVVELLTAYLESALPADRAAEVQAHLDSCPWCQTYLDQIRATIAALGHLPVEALSASVSESLPDTAKAELLAAFRDLRGFPSRPQP